MAVIPLRMSGALEEAVGRVAAREGLDRSTTLRRLIAAGLTRYVADLFREGELTLREAADWLAVPLREAMDRLEQAEVRAAVADLGTWEGR